MDRCRACIVAAMVGLALAGGLVLAAREASAAPAMPMATTWPTGRPTLEFPTPIFQIATPDPLNFQVLTTTTIYTGLWTYDAWSTFMGHIQNGADFLNQYHIINLFAVFGIAALVMGIMAKLLHRKLTSK